jgi:D-threo-aldose 1-dehydrogenase
MTCPHLSPLGLGGAALAGLYEPVGEHAAAETLRSALDSGLTYVDTAPHYGLGLSERRIGAVLRERPRESFVLSTKVGRLIVAGPGGVAERRWDFSRDGIRRSLEESLTRLGLDRVDIVYLHDPDEHEDEVSATAFPALAELRDEGVIRAIGAGMNQSAMLTRFVRRLDLDVVLCAGRYTLLDRSAGRDLLPACRERGVDVVIGGVYNSGLLASPGPDASFDYAPAAPELVARALKLAGVCDRFGVPLRAAAMQFPRRHEAVTSVLVGCRSAAEVADNVANARFVIPEQLWRELAEI